MGPAIYSGCRTTTKLWYCVLFLVDNKQEETHCLSNDACDARFASETRQALETKREKHFVSVKVYGVLD